MTHAPCVIRNATSDDLVSVNEIYNHYVRSSTCTYQEVEESLESRKLWFERHTSPYPVIVAERGGQIIGWGSLSPFHARSAFRFTVENSVYVHHEHQRQKIGHVLLSELLVRAKDIKHRAIVAAIDSGQSGSLTLHAKFGFEKVGHLKQVGYKFGRWLDVVYMELLLW
ncbi:MAG: GNAT family N-acetyltransferase [Nibricoccus sp.]